MKESLHWDLPNPFIIEILVDLDDIDGLGHANNVVYLKWMEKVAWQHSKSMGLDLQTYQRLDRAMVSRRHEMDYFAPCFAGEKLLAATWIIENDQRVRMQRCYQIIRASDAVTLLRGRSEWVCVSFNSGRPKRMPAEFLQGYAVTAKDNK